MRRLLPPLLLGALVLTAGCQSLLGDGLVGDATPTPTESTVFAPGVTEHAVSPTRLGTAHRRDLQDRSYTLTVTTAARYPDGHRLTIRHTRTIGGDGSRHHEMRAEGEPRYVLSVPPSAVHRAEEVWSNGSVSYTMLRKRGLTSYYRNGSVSENSAVFDATAFLDAYVAGAERLSVRELEGDGAIRYRIDAVDRNGTPTPDDDVTASLVVDTFGLIHRFHVRAPTESFVSYRDGGTVTITVRYTDVGNTTVTRPDWVETAIDRTSER
jgi:hypothetical protein